MQERLRAQPRHILLPELGHREPSTDSDNVLSPRRAARRITIKPASSARPRAFCIYVYFPRLRRARRQRAPHPQGFIALGKIEDYEAGVVHRHEQTLSGPKADRLELLRHTRAHTGQLFMIYSDPAHEMEKLLNESRAAKPQELTDEYDCVHRLWPVSDAVTLGRLEKIMAAKKLIIADGHHRYETALAYRNECRQKTGRSDADAPHEVMMTFVHTEQPGVTILPGHRVVSSLAEFNFRAFRDKAVSSSTGTPIPAPTPRPAAARPR
jgi:uncharacterized protein (DUF1015 family)